MAAEISEKLESPGKEEYQRQVGTEYWGAGTPEETGRGRAWAQLPRLLLARAKVPQEPAVMPDSHTQSTTPRGLGARNA